MALHPKNILDAIRVAATSQFGPRGVGDVTLEFDTSTDGTRTAEVTIVLKRKPKPGIPLEVIVRLTDVLRDALGEESERFEPYVRFLTEAELAAEKVDD